MMKLRPVIKETAEAKAVKVLRNFITSGGIAPGSRITETSLSEEMSVSRATVRSALNSLSAEGLVKLTPYTGWMINKLTAREVWELYTLRSSLERLGTRLTAEFIHQDDHKEQLLAAYEKFVVACKDKQQEKIAETDMNLHKTIIDLSGNSILIQHNDLIKHQIIVFIKSSNALITDPQDILAQHTPIVEAILAQDIEKAGQLSEEHNLSEGEKLSRHLLCQEQEGSESVYQSGHPVSAT